MILLTYKWMTIKSALNKNEQIQQRIKTEIFRLISITGDGAFVICERLFDEIPPFEGQQSDKYKGDFEKFELNNMRIIHNSNTKEDELERTNYLKELHILVTGKEK